MRRRAPAQAQGDAERGRARKKRQQRTAECQEYWIRSSDAARRRSQDHARDEETKNECKFRHMTGVDASRPSEPLRLRRGNLLRTTGTGSVRGIIASTPTKRSNAIAFMVLCVARIIVCKHWSRSYYFGKLRLRFSDCSSPSMCLGHRARASSPPWYGESPCSRRAAALLGSPRPPTGRRVARRASSGTSGPRLGAADRRHGRDSVAQR